MAVEIRIGDALEQLRQMPPESVHCCLTSPPYWGLRAYLDDNDPSKHLEMGSEETPDEWCARLVEVFREVKRVLRKDGTFWCNVGDAYSSGGRVGHGTRVGYKQQSNRGMNGTNDPERPPQPENCKPKDLIGQPWLLAFALRADGWFLRDAIVWAKPNPMPESVRDRCTNAYEHVFLLAKDKRYFFDAEAIREKSNHITWNSSKGFVPAGQAARNLEGRIGNRDDKEQSGRNMRNVWTIATEAFSEAHFATFPTELARRCILAGTSAKGVCSECGAPWERLVERTPTQPGVTGGATSYDAGRQDGMTLRAGGFGNGKSETTGWQPSCQCDADLVQATVLDPFGGAGTTALVADRLQRNAILIELNAEYAAMARKRIDGDRGDLLDIIEQPKPEQGSLCLVP